MSEKQSAVQKAAASMSRNRWAKIGKKKRSEIMKAVRAQGSGRPRKEAQ